MKYRDFGATGEKISALGFGCMRFPEEEINGKKEVVQEKVDEMIAAAVYLGVNYFDTAPYYCNHNSEAAVGKALRNVRPDVLISTKCPVGDCKETGDYRRMLERSLKNLGTDYVDFYHFWGINKETYDTKILPMGLLKEAAKAKEEGLIRHISFSFHDEPSAIKYIIDTSKAQGVPMESMLVQYNLLDRSNEEMLAYAHSQGLGTVAMGPVGGGRLSAPTELVGRLTGQASIPTYALAFRFVLGNPNLNCALSGMQNLSMVQENAALASDDASFSETESKALAESLEQLRRFSDLYCTGCKYCQPCPAGIDIPKIFSAYTYDHVYGLHEHAARMYADYVNKEGKTASDCLNCGLCEKHCPQSLKIRENLRMVADLFAEKK